MCVDHHHYCEEKDLDHYNHVHDHGLDHIDKSLNNHNNDDQNKYDVSYVKLH